MSPGLQQGIQGPRPVTLGAPGRSPGLIRRCRESCQVVASNSPLRMNASDERCHRCRVDATAARPVTPQVTLRRAKSRRNNEKAKGKKKPRQTPAASGPTAWFALTLSERAPGPRRVRRIATLEDEQRRQPMPRPKPAKTPASPRPLPSAIQPRRDHTSISSPDAVRSSGDAAPSWGACAASAISRMRALRDEPRDSIPGNVRKPAYPFPRTGPGDHPESSSMNS